MIDSFEFNKIAGAVLATLLFLMGIGIVSNAIYTPHAPEKSAYALPEPVADDGKAAPVKKVVPIAVLLAKADPAKGASAVKAACSACHTVDKGGAVKQGPNLYGIIGRKMANTAGFSYSNGMKAVAEKEKTWSFDHLASFIGNPRKFVSGTKMAYAGMKNRGKLANMLVYLRSLSDSPVALPVAAAAPAPAAPKKPAQAAPTKPAPAPAKPAPTPAAPTPAKPTPAPAAPAAPAPTQAAPTKPAPTPATPASPAPANPADKK